MDVSEHSYEQLQAKILKDEALLSATVDNIKDGILTVKAIELRSNVESQIEIRSQYGISEEEMAKMLLESIQQAESDVQKRSLLEAINEAKNLFLASDKFIDQWIYGKRGL